MIAALSVAVRSVGHGSLTLVERPAEVVYPPDPSWPAVQPDLEAAVMALVNAHRATLGLSRLGRLASLTASSEWKSRHMAQYRYLGHDDPAPPVARTWLQRLVDNGYPSQFAAENAAYGQPTPDAVVSAWLASDGHRENIETPAWTGTGVGAATGPTGIVYWTQSFGVVSDPPPSPPPAPSLLDQWRAGGLAEIQQSAAYKKWRHDNPGHAASLDAYLAAPLGTPPTLKADHLGQGLVDTVRLLAG